MATRPADRSQRPDPHRSQAAAGDAAGPHRADREASLLPVRPASIWNRPRSRFPPSSPPRAVSAWAWPSSCPTSWPTPPTARSASTIPGGTSSIWTSSRRPSSATPWRPWSGTPGPCGDLDPAAAVELDQRQLPAALGCLARPSPPAVRARRVRPDRPARARRAVGRLAGRARRRTGRPGRAGGRRPPMGGPHRPGGVATPFAPTGFHEVWGVVERCRRSGRSVRPRRRRSRAGSVSDPRRLPRGGTSPRSTSP